jgi:methyl-accepting chemotaxis protein
MKLNTNISIRTRIYWSFFLLVILFVINGIITTVTLINNQKLSDHIYKVTDPSLRAMDDLNKMLIESKMYCTNWVFLRSSQSDKDALLKIHNTDYLKLRLKLTGFASQWINKRSVDSLYKVLSGFELLQLEEKKIMGSLRIFEDYNDPLIKLEAERIIEDEVLPRTMALINLLNYLINDKQNIRADEEANLTFSSGLLRILIIAMAVITACIGLLLSVYMTNIIISPINKIRHIVNELGKGIIQKTAHLANSDEIGEMSRSVNNLSDKLQKTAQFAHEVGLRNFTIPFQPLSDADTLGKALLTMRDNLKESEAELLNTTADLVQRNKELEQFAYMVSHNLRAPVANILGFTYVLNSIGKNNNMQLQPVLEALCASAKKLDDIIIDLNQILQARRQSSLDQTL